MLSSAALIARLTFSRARSACAAAVRSRPPNPTALASSPVMKSISSRISSPGQVVVAVRLVELGPQGVEAGLVLGLRPGVQELTGVPQWDVRSARQGR